MIDQRPYKKDEIEYLEMILKEIVKFSNNMDNLLSIPEYTDNTAADADVTLQSGSIYTITGNRTIYKKP